MYLLITYLIPIVIVLLIVLVLLWTLLPIFMITLWGLFILRNFEEFRPINFKRKFEAIDQSLN